MKKAPNNQNAKYSLDYGYFSVKLAMTNRWNFNVFRLFWNIIHKIVWNFAIPLYLEKTWNICSRKNVEKSTFSATPKNRERVFFLKKNCKIFCTKFSTKIGIKYACNITILVCNYSYCIQFINCFSFVLFSVWGLTEKNPYYMIKVAIATCPSYGQNWIVHWQLNITLLTGGNVHIAMTLFAKK